MISGHNTRHERFLNKVTPWIVEHPSRFYVSSK